MTTAADRALSMSPLALIAFLLVGLAPQSVLAHGTDAHHPAPTETHRHVHRADAAAAVAITSVSPSCPAGSDKPCGCGSLVALGRSDETGVLDFGVRNVRVTAAPARVQAPAAVTTPRPILVRERPAPRAPPLFS